MHCLPVKILTVCMSTSIFILHRLVYMHEELHISCVSLYVYIAEHLEIEVP